MKTVLKLDLKKENRRVRNAIFLGGLATAKLVSFTSGGVSGLRRKIGGSKGEELFCFFLIVISFMNK